MLLEALYKRHIQFQRSITNIWQVARPKRIRRRVPTVLQMSMIECGPACLAMILNYFEHGIHLSEIRQQFSLGRDGTNAHDIAKVAQNYNLDVKAYSIEPEQLNQISLPAIAHWDFNHFVVIENVTATGVSLINPASGPQNLSFADFSKSFTGVILTFKPNKHFQPSVQSKTPYWIKQFTTLASKPEISKLFKLVLAASFILQIAGLGSAILTQLLIDQVLPLYMDDIMWILMIGILIFVFFLGITRYIRAILLIHLQTRVDVQMMLKFTEHLFLLPFSFFQKRSNGDLLMRLSSNNVVREIMMSQTLSIFLDGSLTIVYLFVLYLLSPTFWGLTMVLSLCQITILGTTAHKVNALTEQDLLAQAESQSFLVESLAGMKQLKAIGGEKEAFNVWTNLFFKQLNISIKRNHITSAVDTIIYSLQRATPLLLIWLGISLVIREDMSLGTMFALIAIASAIISPLAALVANGQRLQTIGAHFDRIGDVIEEAPEQDPTLTTINHKIKGKIEIHNMSFRYTADNFVLKNISLSINPGEKIAIVGETGSGKSTLAMLLLGLYAPSHGVIQYDDILLDQMSYASLRKQIGIVLQEPFVLNTSIRKNIAFGNDNLSMNQVMRAAQLACIHDTIINMPMGYETIVAEGGSGLSGGQLQRIDMARALVNNPSLLIFDEATSHLDAATEAAIYNNLDQLKCTRIIIAHRLSTIRNADHIIVLKDGEIIESGKHTELIRNNAYYSHLLKSQMDSLETAVSI